MQRVHFDHNATTPIRPEARALYEAELDRLGGNPSSVHTSGRAARAVLDNARERCAVALGVHEDELVFTSGGTESDNLALFGALAALQGLRALITTAAEHSAVLAAADELERSGHRVVRTPVDREGRPLLELLLREASASDVGLVSVMAANNEVGALGPLAELGAGLAGLGRSRPLLHTDAVQLLGRRPLALRSWGVDLASFSAHKVGGPLGVGLLYRRRGVALHPRLFGGGQEYGLRPGTENVPAIAAAALAIELAQREQPDFAARTAELCRSYWQQVQRDHPRARLNGPALDAPDRLPNTLNLELPGIDGRVLVARLDLEGLELSAGSACASGSLEPSHVLLAMGLDPERARSGLRLSFGRTNTAQDVHIAVDILRRTFFSAR